MADVKVLIEGYTSKEREGHSCPTITLVRDEKIKMIVDPGVLSDVQILIKKLKEEGLTTDDINMVFITHSHIDHYRNVGIFQKARVIEFWGWWEGDFFGDYEENITNDIKIIKTPGHSTDGLTLLVRSKDGTVAICGDVFWKEDYPTDDPYAVDKEKLKESRRKVLEMSDYVIPGHGKMFKVEK
jgi:glyoxylase-like metal-dependent hydrolase (beta-lactamase superfamily II)